jgi:hypothetical protein
MWAIPALSGHAERWTRHTLPSTRHLMPPMHSQDTQEDISIAHDHRDTRAKAQVSAWVGWAMTRTAHGIRQGAAPAHCRITGSLPAVHAASPSSAFPPRSTGWHNGDNGNRVLGRDDAGSRCYGMASPGFDTPAGSIDMPHLQPQNGPPSDKGYDNGLIKTRLKGQPLANLVQYYTISSLA